MSRALSTEDLLALVECGRELSAEVDLKVLLQKILLKASRLTHSPDSSIILYDPKSKSLYFAAATGKNAEMLLNTWGEFSERRIPLHGSAAGEVFRTGEPSVIQGPKNKSRHFKGVDKNTHRATNSMLCVPLTVGSQRLGVMQILNRKSGRYAKRDRILLEHFASQASVAIRNAQMLDSLLAHMGLYASRDQGEGPLALLSELDRPARSERLSVLFADMRGFTQLCQMLNNPEKIQELLNEFLAMLADDVISHHGLVNKFLGDGVLALFRREGHEEHAVRCAFSMMGRFDGLLQAWNQKSNLLLNFLDIGIGIVTDEVVIGTIRSGKVSDFTAVGTAVNLAAYLEQHARNGKRILVDRMTYLAVRELVGEVEGPEEIELRKPNQAIGHPYVRYHLKTLRGTAQVTGAEEKKQEGARQVVQRPIFISYSHKDKDWLTRLKTHLKPYERSKKILYWDDTKIRSGARWRDEIKKSLETAGVAVLLVSPDFLASDFIADNELPPLLNAAQTSGLRILWVPVRPSAYQQTEIREYQATIEPAKHLSGLSEAAQDEALVRICEVIASAVQG